MIHIVRQAFEPPGMVEANRLRFSRLVQTEGQSAQSFCNSLQVAAENCNFGPAYSMTLKSRLLAGIWSDSIRERLLAQSTALDYSGTKALFLQMDAARTQSQVLARAANVNAIRQPAQHQRQVSGQPRSSRSKQQPSRSANASRAAKSRPTSVPDCFRCGHPHNPDTCPARTWQCFNCQRVGRRQEV